MAIASHRAARDARTSASEHARFRARTRARASIRVERRRESHRANVVADVADVDAADMDGSFIGSTIYLVSHSDIRYEGVLVNIDPVESTLTLQNGARVRGETTRRGRGGRTRARDLREATIADDEERLTTANVGRERSAIVRNGGKTDEWGADPAERGGVRVHHV
jgi:hypothetical protein